MINVLSIVRTNSPTSIRLEDGLGYTSVWATPPKGRTFWDDAQSLISGITDILQTLNRMCERSSSMDRAQATALLGQGDTTDRWASFLRCNDKEPRKRP